MQISCFRLLQVFEDYSTKSFIGVRGLHKLIVDPLGHCGIHGMHNPSINSTAAALVAKVYGIYTFLQMKTAESGTALGVSLKWAALSSVLPRIVWMVLGSDGGYVTARHAWPAVSATKLYLGHNDTLISSGVLPRPGNVTYTYDPSNPCRSYGGFVSPAVLCCCCAAVIVLSLLFCSAVVVMCVVVAL